MLRQWLATALCFLCIFSAVAQSVIKMCPKCGHQEKRQEKRQEANYCIHCGEKLKEAELKQVLICPKCQIALDKGGKFCGRCGSEGEWKEVALLKENYEPLPTADEEEIPEEPVERGEEPLIYPGCVLLQEYLVQEDFYHTSQQRAIVRKLFSCPGNAEEVEAFYRRHYEELSVMKAEAHNCFRMLHLKLQNPKEEIQFAFYAVVSLDSPEVWKEQCERLKKRFAAKLEPVQKIEEDIAEVKQSYSDGRLTSAQAEDRLRNLQNRYNLMTNSATYWNTKMMYETLATGKNLLLITHILQK